MRVDGYDGRNSLGDKKQNKGNVHEAAVKERGVVGEMIDKVERGNNDG